MKISNLVFDCDGVITDGKYYYTEDGKYMQTFHANDSVASTIAKSLGLRVIMITSGGNPAINHKRAEDLGLDLRWVEFGQKITVLHDLELEATAYIGDCLDDIPIFEACGVAFAPADALPIVREAADYVLERKGGCGCVLEAVLLLQEKGYA